MVLSKGRRGEKLLKDEGLLRKKGRFMFVAGQSRDYLLWKITRKDTQPIGS
jgi:hypothetical protein|tara:strand:+ start:341 stop:493 length:153 start_codon:yes stop_codon:yes gene_type:complete